MDGHGDDISQRRGQSPTAIARHANRAAGDDGRGRGSKRDDRPWTHRRDFLVEPHAARQNLLAIRALVDAALALRPPFEMFYGVREVDALGVDAGFVECGAQQRTCGTDKWMALAILDITGLFTDQHHGRAWRAFAKDGLRRVLKQRTPAAGCGLPAQTFESRPFWRGHPRRHYFSRRTLLRRMGWLL